MTETVRAIANGVVVAESADTVVVEGNHYFPAESLRREHFVDSEKHTICSWKGRASYYTVTAGGTSLPDVAWYYPDPSPKAQPIAGRVAFGRGVEVVGPGAPPA